jgi:hypothetical protein
MHCKIENLHNLKHYPVQELEFLNNGVLEIINCHQVLKYSYCNRFYMSDEQKIHLFDIQQSLLEEACDRLHELIEKPLDPYLDENTIERTTFF